MLDSDSAQRYPTSTRTASLERRLPAIPRPLLAPVCMLRSAPVRLRRVVSEQDSRTRDRDAQVSPRRTREIVGLLFRGGREEELGHHPFLCLRRLHRRRSYFRPHGGGDRRWNLAPLASFAQVFGNLLREHRRITTLGFRYRRTRSRRNAESTGLSSSPEPFASKGMVSVCTWAAADPSCRR